MVHNLTSEFAFDAGLGWPGVIPGIRACNYAIIEFAPVPRLAHIHDAYNSGLELCAPVPAVRPRSPQLVYRFRVAPSFNPDQLRHH